MLESTWITVILTFLCLIQDAIVLPHGKGKKLNNNYRLFLRLA